MNNYQEELEVAKNIAQQAGAIMLQYFDGEQGLELKQDNSFVTVADKKINQLVIEELAKHFDDILIGEEESTGGYGMGRRWLCDPIDGTKAFVWGTPTAMFSLALVVDGMPVLGVAYDPFLNKLYEAVSGEGAYCNGKQLHVSTKKLTEGVVGVISSVKGILKRPGYLVALAEAGVTFATFSGAVYKGCLIACGKITGFPNPRISPHDIAAVHVIIEEAGGKVTSATGDNLDYSKPFKGAILSNGVVHEELIRAFREHGE
jgi:fructose-1,6-bisphosphatase/inositol monophosphatase family enzyme